MIVICCVVFLLPIAANCIYVPGDEVTKPVKRQEVLQWPSAHKYGNHRLVNNQQTAQNSAKTREEPRTENFEVQFPVHNHRHHHKQDSVVVRVFSGSDDAAACPSKETGQFVYRPDCRKFVNCWKGRGFVQACAPGTLFNPDTLECDFPAKVSCLDEREEPDYVESGMIDVRLALDDQPKNAPPSNREYASRAIKDSSTGTPTSTLVQLSPWIQPPALNQPARDNSGNLGDYSSTRKTKTAASYPQPASIVPSLSPWIQPPVYQQNQMPSQSQYPEFSSSQDFPSLQSPRIPQQNPESSQQYPRSNQQYPPPSQNNPEPSYLSTRPTQQYPPTSQQYPSQQNPSQQYPSRQYPSQQYPQTSQQYPSQQNPSQQYPSRQYPSQQYPQTSQQNPSQQYPQPSQQNPSQQYPQPTQQNPSQQYPQPSQQYPQPSQQYPSQQYPSQQYRPNPQSPEQTTARPTYQVSRKPKTDCSMPEGTGLAPHPTDCTKFLNCWKGTAHTQACSTGTLFNGDTLQCDFPLNVDCSKPRAINGRAPSNQDPAPGKKWSSDTYEAVQHVTHDVTTTPRWIAITPPRLPRASTAVPMSYDPFASPSNWPVLYTSSPQRPSTYIDRLVAYTHPTQRPPTSYFTPIVVSTAEQKVPANSSRMQLYYDAGTGKWKSMPVDSLGRPFTTQPISTPTVQTTTTSSTTVRPSTTSTARSSTVTKPSRNAKLATSSSTYRQPSYQPYHARLTTTVTSTTPPPTSSKPPSNIMSIPYGTSTKTAQNSSLRYLLTKPSVGYSELHMTSGQVLRLRGGAGPHEGYVEVQGSTPGWGLVCDEVNQWSIIEATVVCRQLGFVRGAELSWQGRPIRPTDDTIRVSVSSVSCTGNEATFASCRVKPGDGTCLIARDAAAVKCYRNHAALCRPGEMNHDGKCYSVVVPSEETAHEAFTHGEALADCQKRNAKLLDINSQSENDFVSEWLLQLYPDVNSVITSGIVVPVMGHSLWIWEGSGEAFTFHKWWPGWTGSNTTFKLVDVGQHMQCVVAKRVFPCMPPYLPDVAGEANMCEANYFYWDTEDCSLTHDHPYVCERPNDDIGCIVNDGQNYNGTANVTVSGTPCLPWDSPLVPSSLKHRVTDKVRSVTLAGHNYCRNVGGTASEPGCYAGVHGQYESCDIPACVHGGIEKAISSSNFKCSAKEFQCQPNECVLLTWLCDGEKDCINGRDEKDCSSHLSAFKHQPNKLLVKHDAEKWLDTSSDLCAKRCIEAKAFTCRSFSHNPQSQVCILSDSNVGLSGKLKDNEVWQYYELEATSLPCHNMFRCDSGKCVNKSMVCNGRNDCGDRSDENDCSVKYLDYDIRLTGSNNTHEGRVEIKVFGQWGSICDDLFGLRDAEVVCRELGFNLGAAEFCSYSSNGSTPVYLVDDLQCRGNETTIRDCEFDGWGVHDCGPEEVVGVVCRVPGLDCAENHWRCDTSDECISVGFLCDNVADCDDESDESDQHCDSPVELRLMDGPNNMSGRVEVRYHGVWGTVCDDDFTQTAAQVICSALGFTGLAEARKDAAFGPGEGQIWLDQVLCVGNETRVEDCRHAKWGENNCGHEEDASVICAPGDLRRTLHHIIPKSLEVPPGNAIRSASKEILPAHCGLPLDEFLQLESERVPRVLGGNEVPRGSLPWQASIRVRTAGKSVHWCGAVVISPLHVLTAGHCMVDYMKGAYFVRAGDYDTEASDNTEQEANVEEIYIHEEFNSGMRLNNDIALVKLKAGGLRLNLTVQPICLPPATVKYTAGINCTISGWGSVKAAGSGFSRTLRSAKVPILPDSTCTAKFVYGETAISPGMVCAGQLDGGSDSCQGDSGGPLICMSNGLHTLYGITSWGHGCGRINKPGVYSRVGFYRSWIDRKLKDSMGGK